MKANIIHKWYVQKDPKYFDPKLILNDDHPKYSVLKAQVILLFAHIACCYIIFQCIYYRPNAEFLSKFSYSSGFCKRKIIQNYTCNSKDFFELTVKYYGLTSIFSILIGFVLKWILRMISPLQWYSKRFTEINIRNSNYYVKTQQTIICAIFVRHCYDHA